MNIQKDPARSVIYICSAHPLACQRIEDLVLECASDVKSIKSIGGLRGIAQEEVPGGSILLLDTCSTTQWPECASRWQATGGKTILLVAPEHWKQSDHLRILYLGISGVVPISDRLEIDLPKAIASVNCGGLWVNSDALYTYIKKTGHAIHQPAPVFKNLTSREEQIALLIARGLSNLEIATVLEISERTTKFHVSNILQKCNVQNRKHLIVMSAGAKSEPASFDVLKSGDGSAGPPDIFPKEIKRCLLAGRHSKTASDCTPPTNTDTLPA